MSCPALRSIFFSVLSVTAACSGAAAAQGLAPTAVFIQGGGGQGGVNAASIGALWPWSWHATLGGAEVTAKTELYASHWSAPQAGAGRQGFVQLGLVPLFRLRPSGGQSPWFFEGGIGLSITDRRFETGEKAFSTRWNFSDNLAVGRNLGDRGQHELSLRWQHSSNAGLKKPNPGQDMLLVRYTANF